METIQIWVFLFNYLRYQSFKLEFLLQNYSAPLIISHILSVISNIIYIIYPLFHITFSKTIMMNEKKNSLNKNKFT